MIEGEFASMSELAKYNPALVPKPYACGQFKESHVPSESATSLSKIVQEDLTLCSNLCLLCGETTNIKRSKRECIVTC